MSSSDKSTQPKLPGEGYAQNIRARFWLTGKSGAYAGIGRITLLEKIHERGSINQAAKEMKMSYKKAWKLEEIINLFKTERGKHFDPKLVDLFLENLDTFLEIRDRFQD